MAYSLGEAAQATGKNKTTIQRAIQSGRLSAIRTEDGRYLIDPVELDRVFPLLPAATASATAATHHATPDATPRDPDATALLQEQLRAAEQRNADLEAMLADTRAQRDAWQTQAQRLAHLLPPPQDSAAAMTEHEETPRQPEGFWRRLMRRRNG